MKDLLITKKGKEIITKMIAGKTKIKFTRVVMSDYDYTKSNIEELEKFKNVRQEIYISKVFVIDKDMVEVLVSVDNTKVTEGYYVRAIGVYVKDLEENEILYAVSTETENPNYIPAFGGKTAFAISYKLITKVNNSEQVIVEINPAGTATIQQVDLIDKSLNEHINNKNVHVLEEDKKVLNIISKKTENIGRIDNSVEIGEEAKTKGDYSVVIGYGAESEKDYGTAIGFSSKTKGRCGVAIGDNVEVKEDWTIGIGQRLIGSHKQGLIVSPAKEGYNWGSTTTERQILLGCSSVYTPYAYNGLSVISDERDKEEIKEIEYDSLEFVNKLKARQYKYDVRSEYTRLEELTEEEYNKLDEYNKKHKVIEKTIYSINDEIKFVDLGIDKVELYKLEEKYRPLIKSEVETSKEKAIGIYRKKYKEEEIEIEEIGKMKLMIKELEKDGSKRRRRVHNGFIAQEVKEVAEEMGFDFAGVKDHKVNGGDDVYSLTYEEFIAPMVGAIQQLTEKVNYLEEELQIKNKTK